MASPTKRPRHLQPISTNFHNKSFSSIASGSDSGTFHSAQCHSAHMELRPMSQMGAAKTTERPISPFTRAQSSIIASIKMDRQDSGYSEGGHTARSSTSSSRRPLPSKLPSQRQATISSNTSSTRPSTTRASKSAPTAITNSRLSTSSSKRPGATTRHSLPVAYHPAQSYQFFHFPTFDDPQSSDDLVSPMPSPPPATVQYWTSDSTRRLEYAAIDAASRGVKGFLIKLIPDCILPAEKRRTRFCQADEDNDSDLGSVRRYRLDLPEEKECPRPSTAKRRWTWGFASSRRNNC